MMTAKQKQLLDFISEKCEADGVAPSFDEMKDHLGLKSKSGVHRLVNALEERGFIRRLTNRARAIMPTHMRPETNSELVDLALEIDAVIRAERNCKMSKAAALRSISALVRTAMV